MLLTVSTESSAPQVLEVPTGTLVGEVLALAGVELMSLQALVVGGYFGTWIPVDVAATLPLTHAGLKAVGGALGAGIILALPHSACGLVETAHVLSYLADQTAGQCGPCVRGLPAIAGALHELAHGPWPAERRGDLERWLSVVAGRGACRHPDGAVRFAASALQVFGHDVERHEVLGPCPAASQRPSFPVGMSRGSGWR